MKWFFRREGLNSGDRNRILKPIPRLSFLPKTMWKCGGCISATVHAEKDGWKLPVMLKLCLRKLLLMPRIRPSAISLYKLKYFPSVMQFSAPGDPGEPETRNPGYST